MVSPDSAECVRQPRRERFLWQKSSADDQRLTIEPDIAMPVTAADYFAGRDPVLEALGET